MEKFKLNFFKYLENAKNLLASKEIPDLQEYFNTLDAIHPNIGFSDQILFVSDFSQQRFAYLSPNTLEVKGYHVDELIHMGIPSYMGMWHPKDAEIVLTKLFSDGHSAILKIPNFDKKNLKTSYNYRLKQKDGSYKMLMAQSSYLATDENLNPILIIGTVSDITEIQTKPEIFCRVHYKSDKGKWNKIFERFYSITDDVNEYSLSTKEIEIIKFVNKGLSSKEIAKTTSRSEETIKKQRKSILAKTKCQRMTEVVALANKNGWV